MRTSQAHTFSIPTVREILPMVIDGRTTVSQPMLVLASLLVRP
ncbi:hypothetical protein [Solirubrobacter ginsenosidimutans]|nr:hypothetical protein [Solirubrobacter ginsenosidimutans]